MPSADSVVRQPRRRLGEILLDAGIITQEQLAAGLVRQKEARGFLGQALVELGFITQDTLMSFLVRQCRIPHINLLDYQISKEILSLVPQDVCLKYGVLPIDKLGKILTVAMVDPLDIDALEPVRIACPDLKIKPILCEWSHFNQVTQNVFHQEGRPSDEISAASLGLAPMRRVSAPDGGRPAPAGPQRQTGKDARAALPVQDAAAAAIDAEVDAVIESARGESPHPATPQPRQPVAHGTSQQELAGSINRSLHEAMREAVASIAQQTRSAASDRAEEIPTAQEMAALMRESVRDAMRESMSAYAKQAGASQVPSPQDLAAGMRESIRDAMGEVLATFVKNGAAGPSAGELAEVMRSSLHDAAREAMADVTQLVKAQAALQSRQAAAAPQPNLTTADEEEARKAIAFLQQQQATQEARIGQLTEAALQAAHAAQSAVQAVLKAQESQAAQMMATVEAAREAAARAEQEAKRAADQFESTAVREQTKKALQRDGTSQRKRRRAASILGKSESDILEAIEGPGVKLRVDERIMAALESEAPLPGYTFATFLVGKSNSFTLQVCKNVAEAPGSEYNPLFLYGDVGVGKTHLINAVGNHTLNKNSELCVGYVSASRFARKLTAAIDEHALDRFREAYSQWDVLVLDDIQFLGGRIEAQEEFFHIFNALHQEGRQILIAGDNPPDRLGQLEKRLVSRFTSGIVVSLQPPDWETRIKILRHQAEQAETKIPEEILSLIATRVTTDIRKMTGSLRKVIAFADLMGQAITVELANETLTHLGVEEPK